MLALFFTSFCLLAQDTVKPNVNPKNSSEKLHETDETKILLNSPNTENSTSNEVKEFSFFSALWKFILMLALVCGLAYIVLRLLKKANAIPLNDDPYLKIAASLKLAPNKLLYVVILGREAFLISLTEKTVNLISKLENKELIDTLILNADNRNVEERSFADMLAAIFKKNPNSETFSTSTNKSNSPDEKKYNTVNTEQKNTSTEKIEGEFLANMRERLNRNSFTNNSEISKGAKQNYQNDVEE